MVFSLKVMPPGVPTAHVPSTPVNEEVPQIEPDFHFALEANDDDTFADLRERALQYIEEDRAEYLQLHPSASLSELKLEKGTSLRPKQKVSSIFPNHASGAEIMLLLFHNNVQQPQGQKRKATEVPLPTPDTLKRAKGSKGKERATELDAGPSSGNAIERIMSSQQRRRAKQKQAHGDPKQAPHWSLEEDRAFLPYILQGKSAKDALELAGLDASRSEAAGRNRKKFYLNKSVTLDNLEEVRIRSSRDRHFARNEAMPDSTQFPPKSDGPAPKRKKNPARPKKTKSLGSGSMPPPPHRSNRMSAPSTGTYHDSTQSTDDVLLGHLDGISDDESDVIHNSMASRAPGGSARELTLAKPKPTSPLDPEPDDERVVETQNGDGAGDAPQSDSHHSENAPASLTERTQNASNDLLTNENDDDSDVIEFEDMSGSVDEEISRSDLGGDRLIEVYPSDDEYESDIEGDEDYEPTYMRVSEAAYQRMEEAGRANREAMEDLYRQGQNKATVDDDTGVQGLSELPLPVVEPEQNVGHQAHQVNRPPRQHAPDLTDEALEQKARKKCVHYNRDGAWYLDFLIYQRDLQYARDEGDEERAQRLTSDFDHLDMQYRMKHFKRGPETFDGEGDFDYIPVFFRPGDDVPEMMYSQEGLKRQKETWDRREEYIRAMKRLDEVQAEDHARLRAMGWIPSVAGPGKVSGEVESGDEEYYSVPTSAQKPRQDSADQQTQRPRPQPKLLKAKLSKPERKALNCAAKRARKVASARA